MLCDSVNSDKEASESLISTRKMYKRGISIVCVVPDYDSYTKAKQRHLQETGWKTSIICVAKTEQKEDVGF